MVRLHVPRAEFDSRKAELLARADADGVVLFGALDIQYVTGMFHAASERPVVLGITDDRTEIVVPRLEKDHAERDEFRIDEVRVYFDYPQGEPMALVAEMCESLGIADGTVVADADGSPARNGYEGPPLSAVIPGTVEVADHVTDMREVKSETEIELIREASRWANLGLAVLAEKIEPGRYPTIVCQEAQAEAGKSMLDALGPKYESTDRRPPIQCRFTTGDATYEPHTNDESTRVGEGDNVVAVVRSAIGGYQTELERTMFVGEPTDEQRKYFRIMKRSQEIAFETMGAGVEYGAVEDAVTRYYEREGVTEYTQHHVGHNIGLEGHERPFLDVGYDGELRAGELYTVEPGLYVPGVGGFRHSDTVVVTDEGVERLTYYPRDLASLVVPT
jgi:Xaa-Pro aminopeptidase